MCKRNEKRHIIENCLNVYDFWWRHSQFNDINYNRCTDSLQRFYDKVICNFVYQLIIKMERISIWSIRCICEHTKGMIHVRWNFRNFMAPQSFDGCCWFFCLVRFLSQTEPKFQNRHQQQRNTLFQIFDGRAYLF